MAQREAERHPASLRVTALSAAALLLGGCSWLPNALNPIEWYRDVTGASSHDDTGSQRNEKNLEAGGKEPGKLSAALDQVYSGVESML